MIFKNHHFNIEMRNNEFKHNLFFQQSEKLHFSEEPKMHSNIAWAMFLS